MGGSYVIVNRMGGKEFEGTGEYLEIDRPQRLVFSFKIAQFSDTVDRVVVEIAPLVQRCRLTLTQTITVPHDDGMPPQAVATMLAEWATATEQGWAEMLDLLAKAI